MAGYGGSDVSGLPGYAGSAGLEGDVGMVGIYGTYAENNAAGHAAGLYGEAVLGYHFSDWRFTNSVWGETESFEADGFIGAVELGYGMDMGNQFTLTPWGQLAWQTIDTDLAGDAPDSVLTGRLGLRGEIEMESIRPYAEIGVITDFGSADDFTVGPESLAVEPFGTGFEGRLGFEADISAGASLYAEIGGLAGGDVSGLNGSAGLRFNW